MKVDKTLKTKMNKGFRILDHTADVRFEIIGKNYNELFYNAHLAFISFTCVKFKNQSNGNLFINMQETSLEYLLLEYLKEINYYLTVKKLLLIKPVITISTLDNNYNLVSNCEYLDIRLTKTKIKEEIKAFTLHDLNIEKQENIYKVKILLDI